MGNSSSSDKVDYHEPRKPISAPLATVKPICPKLALELAKCSPNFQDPHWRQQLLLAGQVLAIPESYHQIIEFFLFAHRHQVSTSGTRLETSFFNQLEHQVQDRKFCLVPAGHMIWINYREQNLAVIAEKEGALVFTYEDRGQDLLVEFLKTCCSFFDEHLLEPVPRAHSIVILEYDAKGERWSVDKQLPARKLETLLLPNEDKKQVLEDLQAFLQRKQRYQDLGMPCRRGYLFYGPPGTGKTTTLQVLASQVGHNLAMLSLTNFNNDTLKQAVNALPKRSILVLEDLDRMRITHAEPTMIEAEETQVTMSALLNVLDGIMAPDKDLIVFMTTNHCDRLDPALIRPGRVDFRLAFTFAVADQVKDMFLRFFPGAEQEAQAMSESFPAPHTHQLTMAAIQGCFQKVMDLPPNQVKIDWTSVHQQ